MCAKPKATAEPVVEAESTSQPPAQPVSDGFDWAPAIFFGAIASVLAYLVRQKFGQDNVKELAAQLDDEAVIAASEVTDVREKNSMTAEAYLGFAKDVRETFPDGMAPVIGFENKFVEHAMPLHEEGMGSLYHMERARYAFFGVDRDDAVGDSEFLLTLYAMIVRGNYGTRVNNLWRLYASGVDGTGAPGVLTEQEDGDNSMPGEMPLWQAVALVDRLMRTWQLPAKACVRKVTAFPVDVAVRGNAGRSVVAALTNKNGKEANEALAEEVSAAAKEDGTWDWSVLDMLSPQEPDGVVAQRDSAGTDALPSVGGSGDAPPPVDDGRASQSDLDVPGSPLIEAARMAAIEQSVGTKVNIDYETFRSMLIQPTVCAWGECYDYGVESKEDSRHKDVMAARKAT
jgi:hypothetical protein